MARKRHTPEQVINKLREDRWHQNSRPYHRLLFAAKECRHRNFSQT